MKPIGKSPLSLHLAPRRRPAFTLVELLVTIAILAILAALLLMPLARAKSAAQRATCVNQVHQISLALLMYAADHADSLRAATNDYHLYFTYREDIQPLLDGHVSFIPIYWNGVLVPSEYNPPAGYDYVWFDK